MITFLFWNLNDRPIAELVARLTKEHDVDVLILAECSISIADILNALNQGRGTGYHFSEGNCERITILTKFPPEFIGKVKEGDRFTIRHIALPGIDSFLVCAVHMASKAHSTTESQAMECTVLSREIQEAEKVAGHSRTILVGDLNMNPFEDGVVSAAGLNAVMTRQIALKRERTVQARRYPFFYNPMWGHFGDRTEAPAGSYYYSRSEHVSYYWNIFDQVLVRPELLPEFDTTSVKIIAGLEPESLLSPRGVPDRKNASDHLPILFKLRL
ncbi:MAG TPA: endonuclease/exonuclease/phosphatase family protein [Blastocatellia bacterium]|nr:endonuclease/exonuclease/phosphatase family protein [Blastocatellia bacterium]